jgi:transcriptional regulator with XRE-family HTH domain
MPTSAPPDDEAFRAALRALLERSGLSMRALSRAMGRDPGYVAALLDPGRPSRARPTPADLVRASDATGIPLATWLEALWGVDPDRLAVELRAGRRDPLASVIEEPLTARERALVADFARLLVGRRQAPRVGRRGRQARRSTGSS